MPERSPELVGPFPVGVDPVSYDRLRRKVLWSLPNGLYLLGSRHGERRNLMTVSWVTQVATSPKLVSVSIEAAAVTAGLVDRGGGFALSILARSERSLVRRFVKPVADIEVGPDGIGKMNGVDVVSSASGYPIVDVAVGYVDCAVRHRIGLGSHVLFVGEVVDCGGEALSLANERPEVLRIEDTKMNYGG